MHEQGQHGLIVSSADVADARDFSVEGVAGYMCPVLQVWMVQVCVL